MVEMQVFGILEMFWSNETLVGHTNSASQEFPWRPAVTADVRRLYSVASHVISTAITLEMRESDIHP